MYLVLWIVLGALIGWIASLITGNNARMGALANIAVGLAGFVIGGFIASLIGWGTIATFSIGGLLIGLLGAVVLLLIVNMITGKSKTQH